MSILFEHPADSPVRSIQLPSPNLGDSERSQYGNVFGTNRNNEVLNDSSANHPPNRSYDWTIRKLTKTQRNNLRSFVKIAYGDVIKVTHYDGSTFNAIFTNENFEYIAIRDDCNYEITLQLMVV